MMVMMNGKMLKIRMMVMLMGTMLEIRMMARSKSHNELQVRLEEVEATAASYGRKMIAKLEEKVRMLENELGSSQMRCSETHKAAVRADRTIKELQFTSEEDQKNFEKLSELVEKLQGKTRTYKKQIEDAEEIAALNLAKFRKAQQQLEEAEDRSQAAENQMGR